MELQDFLRLVADKVEAAQKKNDKEEVIRLMILLRDELDDQIQKNS